jgi:hypothetical protein
MRINLKNKKVIIFLVLCGIMVAATIAFLYYRNAVFSKEVLRLEILGPSNAKTGDEVVYTVTYKNNGNFALQSPKLIFELPGNSLTEDSKTRFTQDLQDVYPGQEGSFTFKGVLLGKEGDIKTAHATLSYMPHNLSVRYESDTILDTKIDTVPITLTYDLPSKIETGKALSYSINYFSSVDYPLENMSIKLDSINGFNFQSSSPTSLDPNEYKLATLEKGKGGRITINGTLNSDSGNTVTFSAHLGMWIDGTFVVIKDVSQDIQMIPSIATPVLTLSQSVSQDADGTYNVHWHVKNDVNGVKNVKVKATLPLGATLGDSITPEDQANNFTWDSNSREMVWLAGDLVAGATTDLTIQVTLPLGAQNPISQESISGEDQFTGVPVQGSITQ